MRQLMVVGQAGLNGKAAAGHSVSLCLHPAHHTLHHASRVLTMHMSLWYPPSPNNPPSVPAGNDLSKWTIKKWWFNGQFFNTINDLISSWNADNKGLRSSFKLLKPGVRV